MNYQMHLKAGSVGRAAREIGARGHFNQNGYCLPTEAAR